MSKASIGNSPRENLFQTSITAEINRTKHLNETVVRHACLSNTNVGNKHLGMGLEFFVVENSKCYKSKSNYGYKCKNDEDQGIDLR